MHESCIAFSSQLRWVTTTSGKGWEVALRRTDVVGSFTWRPPIGALDSYGRIVMKAKET